MSEDAAEDAAQSKEPEEPAPAASPIPDAVPDEEPPEEAPPEAWTPPAIPDPVADPPGSRRFGPPPGPGQTGRIFREGLTQALRQPFLRSLLRVPLKKIAIWGSFLGLLFFLRQFFGVIFLTFVISYITTTIVDRIEPYFSNRRIPVLMVFGAIVAAILGLGYATVPRAIRQGKAQLDKLKGIKDPRAFFETQLAEMLGQPIPKHEDPTGSVAHKGAAGIADAIDVGKTSAPPPVKTEVETEEKTEEKTGKEGEADSWKATLMYYLVDPTMHKVVADNLADFNKKYLLPGLKDVVTGIWGSFVYLMLALLFSFMIVWDIPKMKEGIGKLEHSRLGDVWHQVAPSIATFFRLLGQAFEAQTVIALVNTAFTAVGMAILGIPAIGFLSVIVFVCSYIPILGMWISTAPICVMALQVPDGGIVLILLVIVMVSIVHMVEAYVLNPRIYGYHMKMHPLAVLIVLYLGQHLFGLWGLIIGVPMATYVWRHLILGEEESIEGPEDEEQPPEVAPLPAPG